jgi:3-hydroxyisobutyrate dehydrogenase
MVGGSQEEFDRAKPLLSIMVRTNKRGHFVLHTGLLTRYNINEQGKNIVLCGGAGSGQAVKICNNLVLAISMIGKNLDSCTLLSRTHLTLLGCYLRCL